MTARLSQITAFFADLFESAMTPPAMRLDDNTDDRDDFHYYAFCYPLF